MSNTKKFFNNSNILGEFKANVGEKSNISRQPTGTMTGIIAKKTTTTTTTTSTNNIEKTTALGKTLKNAINEKLSFYKMSNDKKKQDCAESVSSNKPHKTEESNYLNKKHNNKIDIKISVNYPNNSMQMKSQSVTPNSRQFSQLKQDLNHNNNNPYMNYNNYIGAAINNSSIKSNNNNNSQNTLVNRAPSKDKSLYIIDREKESKIYLK